MRNKKRLLAALCALSVLLLTACGGGGGPRTLKPGTYTGQSSENEDGEYGIVTLTIGENNAITAVEFKEYEKNGDLKDENYGKQNGVIANQDYYSKAQHALTASQQYPVQYLETQDLSAVDAISGATISHDQFVEAVEIALSKAG